MSQRAKRQRQRERQREQALLLQQKQQRLQRMSRIAVVAVAVVTIGGLVLVNSLRGGGEDADDAVLTGGSCRTDSRTETTSPPPANHVPNPRYKVNPPSGGNHADSPVRPQIYTAANTPSDGELVHSLEHGYVVLWHRPNIDAADLDAVESVFRAHRKDAMVVPRSSLEVPVAATAWGHRLLCDDVDTAALNAFVAKYANKGPERVPH